MTPFSIAWSMPVRNTNQQHFFTWHSGEQEAEEKEIKIKKEENKLRG